MPDRVEVQNVVCAANVPASTPTEVLLKNVVACQIVRITLRVPAGHAGLTGIAFGYGHQPIVPRDGGAFISSDNETMVFDLRDHTPGPQWSAFTFNTDVQPHTWQVRIEVDELTAAQASADAQPLSHTDIYTAAGQLLGV